VLVSLGLSFDHRVVTMERCVSDDGDKPPFARAPGLGLETAGYRKIRD